MLTLNNDIHENVNHITIKAIAKNSIYYEARYIIDDNNQVHAADSSNFCHFSIIDKTGCHGIIFGYVYYNKHTEEYSFIVYEKVKHPILDRFEAYGMKNLGRMGYKKTDE